MPPTLTRSQINRLGERLRRSEPPSEDDIRALQDLRAEYFAPMNAVQQILRERLGLSSTSRLKTDTTILEKLRRDRTRLATMQDIAGVRIWGNYSLDEQTTMGERIAETFPVAEIDDLRPHPHFGYRAIHVIVHSDGFPVEIQLRTQRQQRWAETAEKFADRFGRGIRYGAALTFVDSDGEPVREDADPLRLLMKIAVDIAKFEADLEDVQAQRRRISDQRAEMQAFRSQIAPLPPEKSKEGQNLAANSERILDEHQSALDRRESILAELGDLFETTLATLATISEAIESDER